MRLVLFIANIQLLHFIFFKKEIRAFAVFITQAYKSNGISKITQALRNSSLLYKHQDYFELTKYVIFETYFF